MKPTIFFILGIFCFIVMTLVHEYGHYITAKRKGLNPEFVFSVFPLNIAVRFDNSTPKNELAVYIMGILSGLFIIGIFTLINNYYLIMLIPYSFGITSDLKEVWKLRDHFD